MHIPTPVTDLKNVTLHGINVEINELISDINEGNAPPQELIERLHVIAVLLKPMDSLLQALEAHYKNTHQQTQKTRFQYHADKRA